MQKQTSHNNGYDFGTITVAGNQHCEAISIFWGTLYNDMLNIAWLFMEMQAVIPIMVGFEYQSKKIRNRDILENPKRLIPRYFRCH